MNPQAPSAPTPNRTPTLNPNTFAATALRWIARLLSLGVVAILAAFAFGEGTPRPEDWLLLAFFPIGLVLGLIVAWWREIPGALLTLASLAAFYLICFANGKVPTGPYFAILASPAALFLIAGLLRRRTQPRLISPT